MAQSNTTATFQILNSIVTALKPLGVKTYLLNRPKTVDDKMTQFVVIDLPTQILRTTKGYDDYNYRTTGVIYAFVRAKTDGTPNIDKQTQLVRSIAELFPLKDDIVRCVEPKVLMRGLDKTDFQVTTITFTLRTKVNAFKTN